MSENNFCPKCGARIPAHSPAGGCPKCMMKAGFETEGPGSSGFEPPSIDRLSELFPQLEILELVGKGGMGAVYKARQPGLDRLVAIKVLPPEVGADAAFSERFSREARAMARLSHPNIVSIYDFGQSEELFYFVMEYVDGANLRQTIQAGELKPEEAVAIVPQICDALQFAHDEGIVHRDIKPENVLIDRRGRVKIADFGLAKLLGEEQVEVSLTHTNQVMGTLHYMAPEQMQGTHDVDHRADIYSLGVVFYELLTGDVPMGRFDPPSRKVQINVRLDEIVLRALAQEPDNRYQHASEVKTDVEMLASRPIPTIERMPDLDDPRPVDVDLESVREEVKIPAGGLIVVGILTCLTALLPIGLAIKTLHDIYDSRITFKTDSVAADSNSQQNAALDGSSENDSHQSLASEPGVLERGLSFAGILRHVVVFVLALILPALGIIITWGGWMMMNMRSRGLAMTASTLALIPSQPAFILGPIFGIWSLILLNRRHVAAAFEENKSVPPTKLPVEPEEESVEDSAHMGMSVAIGMALGTALGTAMDNIGVGIALGISIGAAFGAVLSAARRKDAGASQVLPEKPNSEFQSLVRVRLKVPAIGLLIAGILNLLATVVVLIVPVWVQRSGGFDEGSGFVEGASTFAEAMFVSIIVALCSLAAGTILVVGAVRMFDLQSHSIALSAAVVGILPVAIGFPISLPLGIWALLVLSRQDVKVAFAVGTYKS